MLSKIQISELKSTRKQIAQFQKKIEQLGQHAHKTVGLKDGKTTGSLALWDFLYGQGDFENFKYFLENGGKNETN